MKSLKTSPSRGNGKSALKDGTIKCTATRKGPDGTTCTVEGTCKVDAARECEKELQGALTGCCR